MTSATTIKLQIPSHPRFCDVARIAVAGVAADAGFKESDIEDIKMAVSEACINVIQHAYDQDLHPLMLTFTHTQDGIQIVIRDHGKGFDIEKMKANAKPITAESPKTSGLGLFIMQNLMDSVELTSTPGEGSTITLTKKLIN